MSDHNYPPRYIRKTRKAKRFCDSCATDLTTQPHIRHSWIDNGHHSMYLCISCARVMEQAVDWNYYEELNPCDLRMAVDCGRAWPFKCDRYESPTPAQCAECELGANVRLRPLNCEAKERQP